METRERNLLDQAISLFEQGLYALGQIVGIDETRKDFPPELKIFRVEREPEEQEGVLEFTNKEISKMPKKQKNEFQANGSILRWRKKVVGNCTVYEARYRRNGYNISVSSKKKSDLPKKFVERLNELEKSAQSKSVPSKFQDFTLYYFEKFRKRKTAGQTYYADLGRVKKYLFPYFGNIEIKKITAESCQNLLDQVEAEGKEKTKDDLHSILNQTFKMAQRHGLIKYNPIDIVFHVQHERKHGSALTDEEIRSLFVGTAGTEYQRMFLFVLCTGLRPNEYQTAVLRDENMIVAKNSKRKNGKSETKRIPVCPTLRPFLPEGGEEKKLVYSVYCMRDKMREILPNHTLYDLRTTFYTRCKICGVDKPALDEFFGHSNGVLANTYTDLPDDYLIQEMAKLFYKLFPDLSPN